jgi:phage tail protein X
MTSSFSKLHSFQSSFHVANACWMIALALAFGLTSTSFAADATTTAPNPSNVVAPNYKVAESIAIDKLIQKVYAKSPLNTAVLRKALVDANPKVITGNPQQRVKGGTSIVVPDHGEVIRTTLMPFSAKAPEAIDNNPAASDYQSRKHWVRFP